MTSGKSKKLDLEGDNDDGFCNQSFTKHRSKALCFLLGFLVGLALTILVYTNASSTTSVLRTSAPTSEPIAVEPTSGPTDEPSNELTQEQTNEPTILSSIVSPTISPFKQISSGGKIGATGTLPPSSQPTEWWLDDVLINTPRCGATWEDANSHCYGSCQRDSDCTQPGRTCFFDLTSDCPSVVDLPMVGTLSFAKDIGKFRNHWNQILDKWNMCCGEGHYCSTCYGQSCCTFEPECCRFGDNYDPECCQYASGGCYWGKCEPCPAGTYSPVGGFYARGMPGYTCPPCPPGTTSEEGATECYSAIVV